MADSLDSRGLKAISHHLGVLAERDSEISPAGQVLAWQVSFGDYSSA